MISCMSSTMPKKKKLPFFWIDLEMTGLNPQKDKILEVAIIITDQSFNVLDEYEEVVYQTQRVVDSMNEWCQKTHKESGLVDKIKSGKKIDLVEKEIIELAKKHYGEKDRIVLCGNSVGVDKAFIEKYLLEFSKMLHYRIIDVSSMKVLLGQKFGLKFKKKNTHRALDDIKESIEELKYYLQYFKIEKENNAK